MRYVIATYNTLYGPREAIPFGIVLNNGNKTYSYFDTGEARRRLIRQVSELFDEATFANFGKTFQEMFIAPGKTYTTDEKGERHEIDVNSGDFLDYLAQNYEGPYQYQKPLDVEGDDPKQVLDVLTKQLIEA